MTKKPAVVRNVDIRAGKYLVLSSDETEWYRVDLVSITCSCKCGQHGFHGVKAGACRHILVCRWWAKCLHNAEVARRAEAA